MFRKFGVMVEMDDEALMMADFEVNAREVVAGFVEDAGMIGDFAEGVGEILVVFDVKAGGDLLEIVAGGLELAGGKLDCFARLSDMSGGLLDDLRDVRRFLAKGLEFLQHRF